MLIPSLIISQNISGTIYGDEVILEYISVTNVTKDIETFSNEDGYFNIEASENDILLFSSPFFIDKNIIATNTLFGKNLIVELEPNINKLDEVIISNNSFNEEEYNLNFKKQILYDVDHNMQAYETPSNGNVDFRKIFKRVNKLLSKNKKKEANTATKYISHSEMKKLLLEQNINNKNIVEIIEIPEENINLFLDYCRGKIEQDLLEENNSFLLLDKLMKLSEDFKQLSEN
jgi:hypothetical protein